MIIYLLLILRITGLQGQSPIQRSKLLRNEDAAFLSAALSYSNPFKWPDHLQNCTGKQQSPINVNWARVKKMDGPSLEFHNYDSALPMAMMNNGHSVEIAPMDISKLPSISSGGLPGQFVFAQLHLHWGLFSQSGSEHTVNQIMYQGELHVVHYNQKYGSVSKAVEHPDGLAVLAIFLQKAKLDNPMFRPVVSQLKQIQKYDQKTKLALPVTLRNLLPSNLGEFFRYQGSLTTPPLCTEAVSWTIFRKPISISETQLNVFRSLYDERGQPIQHNARPIQTANGRDVFYHKG